MGAISTLTNKEIDPPTFLMQRHRKSIEDTLRGHCHISNFDSDFILQERGFILPLPQAAWLLKVDAIDSLASSTVIISSPLPHLDSYLFIFIASLACELIPSTSLIFNIIPIISRDSNWIPTAYLGSHPYLIVALNPTLISNALSLFSNGRKSRIPTFSLSNFLNAAPSNFNWEYLV